jgi:hypothetical protein
MHQMCLIDFYFKFTQGFLYSFQPELYKNDFKRQDSNESSSTGEMDSAGKLHFAVRYDKEIEGLVVKVNKYARLVSIIDIRILYIIICIN